MLHSLPVITCRDSTQLMQSCQGSAQLSLYAGTSLSSQGTALVLALTTCRGCAQLMTNIITNRDNTPVMQACQRYVRFSLYAGTSLGSQGTALVLALTTCRGCTQLMTYVYRDSTKLMQSCQGIKRAQLSLYAGTSLS